MSAYDTAKAHYLAGRHEAALALCESEAQTLAASPAGLTLHAAVLLALGRLDDAIPLLAEASDRKPADAAAWSNHAAVLRQAGRNGEAAESLRRSLALADDAPARLLLGEVLIDLGAHGQALACFDAALDREPDSPRALAGRALALHRMRRGDAALAAYERALAADPAAAAVWLNMGVLYQQAGRAAEALGCCETALRFAPDHAGAWANRGKLLHALGRLDEAVASFDRAVALDPADRLHVLDRAFSRLLAGDYARGWQDYEARLEGRNGRPVTAWPWPRWQGEPLAGRSLLVTVEQGHGDTFQFVRYIGLLAAEGAFVTLHVPSTLLPVLASLASLCRLTAEIDPAENFDFQVALLSLPGLTGTGADTIPAEGAYLAADAGLRETWRLRLGAAGFRIGICWQGNPAYRDDARRSVPLAHFLPLADVPGVRLVSLQRRDGLEQIGPAARGLELLPENLDQRGAFLDTAAILSELDLVITSDTAIAHLAGALGRPVWLALSHVPDWRWLMAGETCPWYPTMRLFRQDRDGDWAGVFAHIGEALRALRAAPASAATLIPCSFGELLDKIGILEIKQARIGDATARAHVTTELDQLRQVERQQQPQAQRCAALRAELRQVNETLWDIEDALRVCEAHQDFQDRFIALARAVYINNDRRAALKRAINELAGSRIVEQKCYAATG